MRSVSYGSNSIFSPVGWHFKLRSDLVRMGVSSWGGVRASWRSQAVAAEGQWQWGEGKGLGPHQYNAMDGWR